MTRICLWLMDWVSRLLQPNERDAVLGDLAESCEPPGQALLDLLGLVVRRQAALWGERLLPSIVGIVIGTGLCFYFINNIYGYMARPLTDTLHALGLSHHLVYTNPFDPFNLYIKLSITCGLFLASPYVLWQFWLFVSPDLYRHEKRYAWPFVTLMSTLFVTGGFLGYKLALPAALRFLVSHGGRFWPMVTFNEYSDLAISVIVGVGLVLELPGLCWLVYLKQKGARRREEAASLDE